MYREIDPIITFNYIYQNLGNMATKLLRSTSCIYSMYVERCNPRSTPVEKVIVCLFGLKRSIDCQGNSEPCVKTVIMVAYLDIFTQFGSPA